MGNHTLTRIWNVLIVQLFVVGVFVSSATLGHAQTQPIITTVAGIGPEGTDVGIYSGDGGPATSAGFYGPGRIAFGSDGTLYISDSGNNVIRKIVSGAVPGADGIITGAADEIVTTIAGNGAKSFGGDNGQALNASFHAPQHLIEGPDGSLYISDIGNLRIRRIEPGADGEFTGALDELVTTVIGTGARGAGGDGGPAANAQLNEPWGLAFGSDGSLFIVDSSNQKIRRVVPGADGIITGESDEIITTVVGTGAIGCSAEFTPEPALAASLNYAISLAIGPDGSLFLGSERDQRILRVSPGADGIVKGDGDPGELITGVAGTGFCVGSDGVSKGDFSGDDGPATSAELNRALGLAFSADGTLFISEQTNYRVRQVVPGPDGLITGALDEIITTVAGSGPIFPAPGGFGGDGGPATSALLAFPRGIKVGPSGNLFIGDVNNHRVRKVTFAEIDVVINIKPGSDPNSINTCSGGTMPVTIWGSETLDVSTIDPDQLILASSTVKTVGKSGRTLCSTGDEGAPDDSFFDSLDPTPDGFLDLTCHFVTFDLTGLGDDSTTADLSITGCDDGVGCVPGSGYYQTMATDSVNIVKDCN